MGSAFSLACMPGELARAVNAAATVVDSNSRVPVARATRIEVAGGSATFIATDSEQAIRVSIAADGEGLAHLDTAMFNAKVRALRSDKPVKVDGDDTGVTISQGRTRWKIPVIENSGLDFEASASPIEGVKFDIAPDALIAALRAVQPAFATDERYHLTGAHFESVDGVLRAVATDAKTCHVVQLPGKFPAFDSILIPPEAINSIAALFADGDNVTVTVSEDGFSVAADDTFYRSRVIEGTFPNWRRIIPKGVDGSVVLDGAEFLAAIERASAIGEDANNKNGRFIPTVIRFHESEIEVVASNRVGEFGNDFCAAERDGVEYEMPVSANLLLKALRSFGAIDTIRLEYDSTGKGARPFLLVRVAASGDDFRLVMPLIG